MVLKKEIKEADGGKVYNTYYESSNVLKTSYNYHTNRLTVTFKKGGVYTYFHVPHKIYEEIVNAESIGSAINKNVKQFLFEKKGECNEELLSSILTEIETLKQSQNGEIQKES